MRINGLVLLAITLLCNAGCGGGDGNAQASSGVAKEMLAAINTARSAQQVCGSTVMPAVGSVRWSDKLAVAAQRHSADMASYGKMTHDGSDGSKADTRITDAGYTYRSWGENVAVGQSSVAAVVAGWMASPGHCTNIMGSSFSEIGAASDTGTYQGSPNRLFWTLDLASPQ